ncbi:hypothetical protein GCM10011290_25590 [Vogesella alkaliphila]|uniref:Uncharacterized protein n=1 Tax=Vogesella alkaliphila TaxID=1193621 RepID=A0ABQ2YVF2_9NEIS|nr:hypothetical protein GCM10011290_25590 [Vogesella alkaliphila]
MVDENQAPATKSAPGAGKACLDKDTGAPMGKRDRVAPVSRTAAGIGIAGARQNQNTDEERPPWTPSTKP